MTNRIILFFLIYLCASNAYSQELNCTVTLNQMSNTTAISSSIFKKMENSISQFLNTRKWTDKEYADRQKIECDLIINITSADITTNTYVAEFTIQSKRPVFNSTYETQILRHKDKGVPFTYVENQPIDFSPTQYVSNLSSALAYYANLIIAADMETFANQGGQEYIEKCQYICNLVPTGLSIGGNPIQGWAASEAQNITGQRTRIGIILDYIANSSETFRKDVYEYHINGLDLMADDPKKAQDNILKTLESIKKNHNTNYLAIHFILAKVNELVKIFEGADKETKNKVYDICYTMEPTSARGIAPLKD